MTDWDAATYDRISDPQARWAQGVLERLVLRGEETVLDAGCGSGRVTASLLARLPGGHVVALDASPAMLELARERLTEAAAAGRVTFLRADLAAPLHLDRNVDAIFSNATFHWVEDHGRLFRHLAAVLRPGGQLVAQCGGEGNIASVIRAVRELDDRPEPLTFAGPVETAARLRAAGFVEVRTWLEAAPTPFVRGEPLETFLRTVVLRRRLDAMAEERRAAFVHAVAQRLPEPVLDYVRLNIVARRRS